MTEEKKNLSLGFLSILHISKAIQNMSRNLPKYELAY